MYDHSRLTTVFLIVLSLSLFHLLQYLRVLFFFFFFNTQMGQSVKHLPCK
jgi:hypothetical protein